MIKGDGFLKLCELSTGDIAYRYEKCIVLFFNGKRKVLSTSVFNGGYHEDYQAVFNNDGKQGAGMPCEMLADTYDEHMRILARRIGLDPEKVTGMGTAADMECVSVKSLSYKELTVSAIVTGGIETNGGRVGDPADYYAPKEKPGRPGTINIILVIDCDMPAGTLARALVTCTEAKTAAIQELMAGSNYSTGLATGSGTDQTVLVANAESDLYLESSGKHSKMGELIGRVVKAAVTEALGKQSNLTPKRQHDVFRRLKRFGTTENTLWQRYLEEHGEEGRLLKPVFLDRAEVLGKDDMMLSYTSLYIHLLDQHLWGLLKKEETLEAARNILGLIGSTYLTATAEWEEVADEEEAAAADGGDGEGTLLPEDTTVEAMMRAWSDLFLAILEQREDRPDIHVTKEDMALD